MRLGRLLAALIRGAGAEFLRGDLEEGYQRKLKGNERSRAGSGVALGATSKPTSPDRAYVRDALWSLILWYRPMEIRRRHRPGRNGMDSRLSPVQPGGWRGVEGWVSDARFAFRGLRARPGFTILVVLTLGLGIGATATIYSVVDSVVLRPLPYEDSGRLVTVGVTFPDREWSDQVQSLQNLAGVSYLNFSEVRERARGLQDLAAGEWGNVLLPDEGNGPQMATLLRVTEGFFSVLGVSPILGRTFLPEDLRTTPEQVVMLSHGAWMNRFGGDPGIVGRPVNTFGVTYTVVGVLPQGFQPPEALFPPAIEFWMPLDPNHPRYADRGGRSLAVLGRLAEGATVEQLREELQGLAVALAREYPEGNVHPDGTHFGWGANSLQADTLGATGRTLLIFLVASGLILFISVLNAAHLLLVRGMDRVGEISLRRAVGADRWAVYRLLLAESILLAVGGGALGLVLAFGGVEAFLRFVPSNVPRLAEVAVDLRILAAGAAASLGVGVVTGIIPALRSGGWDVSEALKQGGARTVSPSGGRTRFVMVTAQLALALVLAVGASLLFESFLRVRSVDPGFEPDGLLAFSMPLKNPSSDLGAEAWVNWDNLMREMATVPGVTVAAGSNLPFESPNWAPGILLPGEPPETRRTGIAGYAVTPNYMAVLGFQHSLGRLLSEADGPLAESVVVVNRAFVEEVLKGGPSVGRQILFRGEGDEHQPARIVGVVEDVVQTRAEEPKGPAVYVPYTQTEWNYTVRVVARTTKDPLRVSSDLRQAANRFFPVYPVRDLVTLRSRIGVTQTEPRFHALLLLTFAGVALLLAAVGLYGTLSHMVGRRKRELGIRIVLGAERGSILALVIRQGALAAGFGMGAGLVGALFVTRFLSGFLFQIEVFHLPAFAWAGCILTGVAAFAAVGPARRALKVDPVESLRED